MWLICALLTAFFWGAADLFYKKGANPEDKQSHIKTVIMVGFVMGIHGICYMLYTGMDFDPRWLITYLPVSFCYILSMAFSYFGLRYIELSVASPIQNSSGAVVVILCYFILKRQLSAMEITGIALVLLGVFFLSLLEKKEDDRALRESGQVVEAKYRVGFLAIIFPILYCVLDGIGTFADSIVLEERVLLTEDQAVLAYEFSFLIVALVCLVWLTAVKKEKFRIWDEKDKGLAAILETGGQFFYFFAIAANTIISAPLISSYCVISVLLSRIFLKEKLSKPQYMVVAAVVAGIVILCLAE